MTRAIAWAVALTVTLAACAPLAPKPTAESIAAAEAMAARMDAQRAGYKGAAALVQATTESHGRLTLWPGFTAVLRYTAPDGISLEGYSELGLPLFSFSSGDGRYRFASNAVGDVTTGKLDSRLDPVARVLTDLSHLLDGAVGIDLGGHTPQRMNDGGWRVRHNGTATRFELDNGRVARLDLDRAGNKPTRIEFSDFRPVSGGVAPYRISVDLAEYEVRLSIDVMEWHLAPA